MLHPFFHRIKAGFGALFAASVFALLPTGCAHHANKPDAAAETFTTECLLKYTPVKHQGQSDFCWIYAMLATIESEHLMQGDSVNLSPAFLARCYVEEQARRAFLVGSQGGTPATFSCRNVATKAIDLLQRRGIVAYDAYHPAPNYRVLERETAHLVNMQRGGRLADFDRRLDRLLTERMRPVPRFVFMLGAEYTVQEFAHSVCRPDEYVALTSFAHHPYGEAFALEVPDNTDHALFLNLPPDTLIARLDSALAGGHAVCWEGDTSEPRFCWKRGTARLDAAAERQMLRGPSLVDARQKAFENGQTTDDHCMALIGTARDKEGRRYYVAKNSWGTGNAFRGLMYLSENYVRAKTIALWMSRDVAGQP